MATDAAGNAASAALAPVTVATQPPQVSATQSVSGLSNRTSETITVVANAEPVGGDSIRGVEIFNGSRDLGAAVLSGGAWVYTASGLADGVYAFKAVATDRVGNAATVALAPVTVATRAPTLSASQSVSGLTSQTSDTILVTATAEAIGGDSIVGVEIFNGSTDLGAATLTGGTWTYKAVGLTNGTYAFSAVAKDAAGNAATIGLAPVTVVTQPLTISATQSVSGLTNRTSDTISATVGAGTGDSVVSVQIYDGAVALGAAKLDPSGTWSFTASGLSDGAHTFSAVATDAISASVRTTLAPITVDTQTPAVAITSAAGLSAQTISGTVTELVEAYVVGATVTLTDNGVSLGVVATVGSDGRWSTTKPVSLVEGVNSLVATVTDLAGNAGASKPVSILVDTQTPVVTIAAKGGLTANPHQTISGTVTEPMESEVVGSTVTLFDNGAKLATTTVLPDGTWSASVTLSGDGTHNIVASDLDLAGNVGASLATAFALATQAPTVSASGSVSGLTNQTLDTITVLAAAESVAGDSIAKVEIFDGSNDLGAATLSAGAWRFTARGLLDQRTYTFRAVATDAAGNTGAATLAPVTVDTQKPVVSIAGSGGPSSSANLTLSGVVTEPVEANVVGSTVTLIDNGQIVGSAKVGQNGAWSTSIALVPGVNSIVAQDTDLAGNVGTSSAVSVTFQQTAAPAITSATYVGYGATGHWTLSGVAAPGSTVAIKDGATTLGATVATGGTWTFITGENNSSIRVFTASTSGGASAPYYEGTRAYDTIAVASEPAVSAAALINGDLGINTLQITAPAALSDADFAHVQSVQMLALTGASSVALGPKATVAGIAAVVTGAGATTVADSNPGALTINAAALGLGNLLTVTGSTAMTVTNLTGGLNAAKASGALTVTAASASAQAISLGSGAAVVTDSVKGGSLVIDAAALQAGTLTLLGAATKTVNNLAGNLLAGADGGFVFVNAVGSGTQSITTGWVDASIAKTGVGPVTVDAGATGVGRILTLSGSASETVSNLAANVNATGLTGALSVTTKANGLSIATGVGGTTIDASAMTGTLTLSGGGATTVKGLKSNLVASGDGALKVTTTGGSQSVTTGSGNLAIADGSTGALTVDAWSLGGSLLTLTGKGPVSVANLTGNLDATGDSGAINVTAIGASAQFVSTGSGAMSIADSAKGGSVVVDAAALASGVLTLSGTAMKTVNNLAGDLRATGNAGTVIVNAIGSRRQSVTTGGGDTTINDSGAGGMTVDATASAARRTLTLTGSAAETVAGLSANVVATGLTGALNVTTGPAYGTGLSIALGKGANTINAGTLAGSLLTLSGAGAATVTALGGDLNASADSGALTVTTTAKKVQTVTVGSGDTTIIDKSLTGLTINAAALNSRATLRLSGAGAATVTNLMGALNASGDAGALNIVAAAASPQSIVTGSGATSITDNAKGGSVTVDATALGTGALTLLGTATKTVNALAGSLNATGDGGAVFVNVTGSAAHAIATGAGDTSITGAGTGAVAVDAGATSAGRTLTLSGSASATVANLTANVVATGLTGALNVTTRTTGLSIAAGAGATRIDAGAMTGAMTLSGRGAATVTALRGNLIATGESGSLKVATTGYAQTVTTGSGDAAIVNGSKSLTINAAAQGQGRTLTLSGAGPVTVTGLQGNLDATGDSGAISLTLAGHGPQTIRTGSGPTSVVATGGADTFAVNGGGDSFMIAGHATADSFAFAKTSASPNTSQGRTTIAGFSADGSVRDLLDFSHLDPRLAIEGPVSSASMVAADSIAWLYSGKDAMVYVNDTNSALALNSSSLMEITLTGVSHGLSATNFVA